MTQPDPVDQWEGGDSRRRRPVALVVALVGLVVLVGWLARSPTGTEEPDGLTVDEATPPPTAPAPPEQPETLVEPRPVGLWRQMADAPFTPTMASTGVWADDRLLVFDHSDTGAMWAYDPTTDEWVIGPEAPLQRTGGHVMTWTGREVVIWGGRGADGQPTADGMTYRPDGGWSVMAEGPLSPRTDAGGGWSSRRDAVVIWGGESAVSATRFLADGAAYDPATDGWTTLPDLGLSPRRSAAIVDIPGGTAVFGGRAGPVILTDGALLTLDDNVGSIAPTPVDFDTGLATAGVEERLLVWGRPAAGLQDLPGYVFDPSRGSGMWEALPRLLNQERGDAEAVAVPGTDSVVIWGGLERRGTERQTDGFVFDLVTQRWRLLPPAPLSARVNPIVVATGDALLVWGGSSGGIAPRDGARVRLPSLAG